jgi:hypothetical protein
MRENHRDPASADPRAIIVNAKIKLLIGLHLLALPLAMYVMSCQTWPQPGRPLCFGLAFSDAGLLVLWGALGKSRLWFRLFGAMLGVVSVGALTAFGLDESPQRIVTNASLILLTAGIVLLSLLAMRLRRGLALCQRSSPSATVADLQFSLIHLFMAMTVVACMFSIQKAFDGVNFLEHNRLRSALFVAAVVPCIVAVELATFWAALGLRHALARVLPLVFGGFLIGVLPPLQIMGGFNGDVYLFWSLAFSCQALTGAATLLAFRSCGWRLCFEPAGEKATELQYQSEGPMNAIKSVN